MNFATDSFKNLFSDVSTVFTRAKQYAEETIGTAERTELDYEYEQLAEKADVYKLWTEKIVSKLEAVVQPNPSKLFFLILFFSFSIINILFCLNFFFKICDMEIC